MQQLSGLDNAFLVMEKENVQGHGGGICILESLPGREPLTLDRLVATVEERLHLVPLFRLRLRTVPFGLDLPYWVETTRIDLTRHITETFLTQGATERELAGLVADLHTEHLDRDMPLWELHLVHGLDDGRQALYLKVHHAAIDGVSGNDLMTALLDLSPDGRPSGLLQQPPPLAEPGTPRVLVGSVATLIGHPRRALRLGLAAGRSGPALLGSIARRLPIVDRLIPGSRSENEAGRAPDTPFNRTIGPRRNLVLRSVPFATVRDLKRAMDITVNDVLMAMAAGALRRWLDDQNALPREPLIAAVPVSTRNAGDSQGPGNKLTMLFAPLPTDRVEPVGRARAVHEAMLDAKQFYGALPADLLADVTQFAMPSLAGLAFRISAKLRVLERVKLFNLIISNVPGPMDSLYIGGSRMLAYYPVSQIVDGQGLNITMLSYAGRIHIGVLGDPDLAPDLDRLADYLVDELDDLCAAIETA